MRLKPIEMITINFNVSGDFLDIHQKLDRIMATEQEFNEKLDIITDALENVKSDLDGLKAEIGTLGLSAAVEARMFARVSAIADRVSVIAGETPDVEPEEEL